MKSTPIDKSDTPLLSSSPPSVSLSVSVIAQPLSLCLFLQTQFVCVFVQERVKGYTNTHGDNYVYARIGFLCAFVSLWVFQKGSSSRDSRCVTGEPESGYKGEMKKKESRIPATSRK